MEEKVLIDPYLAGKTREEMGLEPFIDTEIRSSIMGVRHGMDNNKKSPWNEKFNETMYNIKKKGAYSDLSMEKKMLLKI